MGENIARKSFSNARVAFIVSVYIKDNPMPVLWAIRSMLNQTYKRVLIFIRLDGEIKPAVEKLLYLLARKSLNIHISRNTENCGLAYSLNKLVDFILANHPEINYFARMDADDVCFLSRIQRQVDFLDTHHDIDVLGSACIEFGIYNKVIRKNTTDKALKRDILKVTPFIHPSVVIRRRVFESGNRYSLNTQLSEDLAFWLNLALNGYKFHNIEDVLIYYKLDNQTLCGRIGVKKAISELIERGNYLFITKKDIIRNVIYILGHLIIRLMPLSVIKILYRLLR
ncbi:glycosyltransferase [Leminorella grimontii]|uniref:glycosyltransferase n=1 Tax=Leminorella grimontii TaxID=82981 RepID=UPI00208C05AB|nr:glycosyltransferase [Leminorella grimontii]GKX58425.1 glycosyl transferase [Leminorella grimontii]